MSQAGVLIYCATDYSSYKRMCNQAVKAIAYLFHWLYLCTKLGICVKFALFFSDTFFSNLVPKAAIAGESQ